MSASAWQIRRFQRASREPIGFHWSALAVAVLLATVPSAQAVPDVSPVYPEPAGTVPERTPTISFNLTGDPSAHEFTVILDRFLEFTSDEEPFLSADGLVEWTVPDIFALKDGMHNITVIVQGSDGTARLDWNFTVDPSAARAGAGIDPLQAILWVASAFGVAVVAAGAYVVYLWRFKGYSWAKFSIRFPRAIALTGLYLPLIVAAAGAIGGLVYVAAQGVQVRFIKEYIIVGSIVVATIPFTVQTLRGRGRRRGNERAFAQFLFEMADAMRGGIDPVKAIRELAAAGTGPLRRPLKLAADNLRVGRPLDEVLQAFADMTGSPLIGRYTGLVAEAARAGGDISMVVYQAAKDMDELTKIEAERVAAMRTPVMTMYIAFGVLFMITTTLVDFAPKLAQIDFASLAGGLGADETASPGPAIDLDLMTTRFFHLLLISSMGTGLLVGAFTEGNVRYGLHHMLLMAALSSIGFPLLAL